MHSSHMPRQTAFEKRTTLADTEHSRYVTKRAVFTVSFRSVRHAFADMQPHIVEY
jgi:hypothetical protein